MAQTPVFYMFFEHPKKGRVVLNLLRGGYFAAPGPPQGIFFEDSYPKNEDRRAKF